MLVGVGVGVVGVVYLVFGVSWCLVVEVREGVCGVFGGWRW